MWNQDWAAQAACRGQQPDKLFVRGAEQNKAKQVCGACPVRTECLAEALDNQIEWGVWGGMTERERRALLRRRPNASWRAVLEQAREQRAGVGVGAGPARRNPPTPSGHPRQVGRSPAKSAPTWRNPA